MTFLKTVIITNCIDYLPTLYLGLAVVIVCVFVLTLAEPKNPQLSKTVAV